MDPDFIAKCLVDDCILDLVFGIVQALKASDAPIYELCAPQRQPTALVAPDEPRLATYVTTPADDGNFFECLAPFREAKGDFRCAHCGQKVSALRYAPHLDKCMGKGRSRRSGATTTRKS